MKGGIWVNTERIDACWHRQGFFAVVTKVGIPRAAFVLFVMLSGQAPCQTGIGADERQTQEIVVTATRVPSDVQSIPSVVHSLDIQREATETAARTMPEILKGIPSVLIQKTSYGQGSPYLRGFTGFRTLCLIDGIRLNNSVFREGPNQYWNTVDPFGIRAAEVVMGPGSTLYGSDAVGGTLNALTIEPPAPYAEKRWTTTLIYRGATAEKSHMGRVTVAGRPAESLGFIGGASVKSFGDLRGGKNVGEQPMTGYDEGAYDTRFDYAIGENAFLTIAHQGLSQDDVWRTHRTIYGIRWRGLTNGDDKVHFFDQSRALTYARFSAEMIDGPINDFQLTLSRHAQAEDQYRVRKDSSSDRQGFDVVTWGAGIQMRSETPAGAMVYGGEFYRDYVDTYALRWKPDGSFAKSEIQGPVADDALYDFVGVYLEDNVEVFGGRINLIPGARYSYARADAARVRDPVTGSSLSIKDEWDSAVGSLRAVYSLAQDNNGWVVFAGVGQGFRAPNLSDLSRFDMARSNEIETPSPGLKPERYVTWDAGLKIRLERVSAQMAGYYTAIDDMITRTPTGRMIEDAVEVTKLNSGDGYIRGLELDARYMLLAGWSLRFSGALMEGEVDTYSTSIAAAGKEPISRLMPPSMQTGIRWDASNGKLWWELDCAAADKADRLSPDDKRDTQRIPPGGTPGYAVFHARAGGRLRAGLKVGVSVENIFDKDYRIHGSGVNEPGRNFLFTASCDF